MPGYKSCEEFRDAILQKIGEKRFTKFQDIGDPFWSSSTSGGGYNAVRWAVRGFSNAMDLLEKTSPLPGETVERYARRLEAALQVLKKQFYDDPDDEDGFACGAVADVIFMIRELCS